jgi:hypothetical protein
LLCPVTADSMRVDPGPQPRIVAEQRPGDVRVTPARSVYLRLIAPCPRKFSSRYEKNEFNEQRGCGVSPFSRSSRREEVSREETRERTPGDKKEGRGY